MTEREERRAMTQTRKAGQWHKKKTKIIVKKAE